MQHVLLALQYEEKSSSNILIKCDFCNFTLWMPPALEFSRPSPVRPCRPYGLVLLKSSTFCKLSLLNRKPTVGSFWNSKITIRSLLSLYVLNYCDMEIATWPTTWQGYNEGDKQGTFPRVLNQYGGAKSLRGASKSPNNVTLYFLQYSILASKRPQVRICGRQTCFSPRALSNLITLVPLGAQYAVAEGILGQARDSYCHENKM